MSKSKIIILTFVYVITICGFGVKVFYDYNIINELMRAQNMRIHLRMLTRNVIQTRKYGWFLMLMEMPILPIKGR